MIAIIRLFLSVIIGITFIAYTFSYTLPEPLQSATALVLPYCLLPLIVFFSHINCTTKQAYWSQLYLYTEIISSYMISFLLLYRPAIAMTDVLQLYIKRQQLEDSTKYQLLCKIILLLPLVVNFLIKALNSTLAKCY